MNYTDFGVSGPDELEQDEWSLHGGEDGGRPTFETPKGGVLTVLGWKGKLYSRRCYIAKCEVCSQDKELFGDGVFSFPRINFPKVSLPCGCSTSPKWSEDQNKTRVEREAQKRGYSFLGWHGEYKARKTRCRLVCSEHGEWKSTVIKDFLQERGCPHCGKERFRPDNRADKEKDPFYIEKFISSGKFLPGTRFWRSERKDSQGFKSYWNYTCPKCSHDEYVRSGLCSGVFESHTNSLRLGSLSCRCSSTAHRWTQEQREYQIKKEIHKRSDDNLSHLQFVRWKSGEGYVNPESKFIYLCQKHGEQESGVDNFLRGVGCPQCAGSNQRQAYIHVVEDVGIPVAIKLGIANSYARRRERLNRANLFQSENLGVWEFQEVKDCKAAERECKQTLPTGVLSIREMKDGWSETVSVLDLEKVIAIYEKHGGVRIK